MKWILIVFASYGAPVAMTTAEFDDEPSCVAAANSFKLAAKSATIFYVCAAKGGAEKKG